MKPQALVILSPGFPADEQDTVCITPMQVLVRAMQKRNPQIQIIVISFQYPFEACTYYWHHVQVHSLGGRDWGKGFRLITWGRAALRFRKLHQQYQVKGILSFWLGECALIGKYLSTMYNRPLFISLQGQDAKAGNRFFKRVRPKPANLIALSDFLQGTFLTNYQMRPNFVIPLGIDIKQFDSLRQKRSIDVLGVGSLIPLKQYEIFIETVRYLTYFIPDIRTVICGEGPEYDYLQNLIDGYGLQRNVVLAGEKQHDDVIRLMQQSKVFLHPSGYEGFGSVIAEALYAGAHVVSFTRPMHQVWQHHHVAGNIPAMQQKVLELLLSDSLDHDPILTFSADEIADRVMNLFEQTFFAAPAMPPAIV